VEDRQDQLLDLKQNFDDLIIKNKSIDEDVEQMKKQIAEMTNLASMRRDKDYLIIDI
jgi:hypothetical protein